MMNEHLSGLREIGIVLSGSTPTYAPGQLRKDSEDLVEEQLTAIMDEKYPGRLIIGILRNIRRLDPLLRSNVRTPYVEYHKHWGDVYPEMSYTNVYVSLCSTVDLESNKGATCT